MRYGRTAGPNRCNLFGEGFLPVYSVADEREAEELIAAACVRNAAGEPLAPELVVAQTLENLERFSTRLDGAHDALVAAGRCRCAPVAEEPHVDHSGPCAECGEPCTDESWCAGCESVVCDECDQNQDVPWGTHEATDHLDAEGSDR